MNNTPKSRLQRRLFLKALGLGLSAPVAYHLVRQATAAPTGAPQRFLFYYVPHGVPPEHFNPVGEGTNFTLTESGVSILGPLEPYKNLVNVYEGFKYPGASTHEGIAKFLSGSDVGNQDDTTPRTSLEHFIGNEMGVQTLALGAVAHRPFGQDYDGKLMWDGQAVVPEKSPARAYDEVFGSLGGVEPAPGAAASSDEELRQAMLAMTERDVESLQAELSQLTSEKSKLQTHLESIRALKESKAATISCTAAPELPAVDAVRAASAGQDEQWFLSEENFPDILAAQLQVAAASLVCNARPVVGVQPMYANAEVDFGFMGSSGAHHSSLSHTDPQISGGSANMTIREPFAKAQRWFIEQLVEHVITRLDVEDPTAPGSTVLDNTIILIASEIGEGAWHPSHTREIINGPPPGILSHMPIITVGGGAGTLSTGQRLNYYTGGEATGDRPASDLWLTLAQAMGSSTLSFGGSDSPVAEARS